MADVNVEKTLVDYIKEEGFDVLWIPDYDCRITDDELLFLANREKRILITNDTDFGELVYLQKKISTGIILIRVKGQDERKKLYSLKKVIKNYKDKIENHFIVVTEKRIRFRKMEDI